MFETRRTRSHRAKRRSPVLSRSDRERGTAMVEFALVLPLLIGLFMGIFEFGLNLRAQNQVADAAGQAARIASALPKDTDFASKAAARAKDLLNGLGDTTDQYIVIYEADDAGNPKGGGTLPSCAVNCVVYYRASPSSAWPVNPGGWSATKHNACPLTFPLTVGADGKTEDPRTRIGVYVQVKFKGTIPFIGGAAGFVLPEKVARKTVYRLEPTPGAVECAPT